MPSARPDGIELVIPDIHFPDHNQTAVRWVVKEAEKVGPTGVTFLGDMHDIPQLSRFLKGLKSRSGFSDDVIQARKHTAWWANIFKGLKVNFLLGNHEHRIVQYIKRNAPELEGLPELTVRRLLGVPDDWVVTPYGDFIKVQGVLAQHGKKWSNNTSRSNVHVLGCSSVQGHSHRVQMVSHRFAGTGKRVVACEVGCLCNFSPNYAKLTDWSHAYAIIEHGAIHVVTRGGSA